MKKIALVVCLMSALCGCKEQKKVDHELYDGPEVTMRNIDMLVSDSAIVKLRLVARTQLQLANQDRDFPDGIYLRFYSPIGLVTSTLVADKGYYFSKEDYYKAEGNVIMRSLFSGDELSTELLNWDPAKEQIYTDNFVTIKTEDEVMTGEGLEASQNFEEYTILKPSGTMSIMPVGPAETEDN
ncbi:LPS export ABC transporter periplasmic protein LptC [Reichenbachiella carrageenanivorans]|uniref:LPS export ABC transporter periplasmic protein LptC n=1 Tax=Reichenbachiella carrageenanivorans TaxID=2979869 RepID=A0ABY6D3Y2_9BACT|nr:LPS export ABC transporter periplasmic protein LptC [Reichenbachiella carrageenanivorans]UXX80509.1 LPS export ABC transporter periplasmic protein LptC [Reichenbachiella carrageenanivorans]